MRRKYHVEDILSEGLELVRRNGYHNTGINDILRVSGIPKGSFYNFFENKEDFGRQIIEHYGREIEQFIAASLAEDGTLTPLSRIERFYRNIIAYHEREGGIRGCLVNNLSAEVGGINDLLAATADRQFERWAALIEPVIREGQKAGEITSTESAGELVRFIQTNFFGALTRMKVTRSMEPLERFLRMTLAYLRS